MLDLNGVKVAMADYETNYRDLVMQEREQTGTAPTHNEEFDKNGYLITRDLYDPEELYYPVPPERGSIHYYGSVDRFDHVPQEGQVEGSLARYYHPQYKTIHNTIRLRLEEIIGNKLYNTYYYDRFYFPDQQLRKHADRPACEISVTIHVSTNLPDDLKDWPIWIKTPDVYTDETKNNILVPGEERSAVLNPGDGMIYKGCERPHWRDPMLAPRLRKRDKWLRRKQPEYYYHQIFFLYVLADGERSHFKGDRGK